MISPIFFIHDAWSVFNTRPANMILYDFSVCAS